MVIDFRASIDIFPLARWRAALIFALMCSGALPAGAVAVQSVTVAPSTIAGGTTGTGTITLTGPADTSVTPWDGSPVSGVLVKLTSSSPAASIPSYTDVSGSTVAIAPDGNIYEYIPTGVSAAAFAVNTQAVAASTSVKISAAFGGPVHTASLTVTPIQPVSVTISPKSVYAGDMPSVTVALNGAAQPSADPWGNPAAGAWVALSCSSPSIQFGGGSASTDGSAIEFGPDGAPYLVIPAGHVTGTFAVFVYPAPASVSLSAILNGVTKTAALTVLAPQVASISFAPATVYNGDSTNCTVTLTHPSTLAGNPNVYLHTTIVTLSSSTARTQFASQQNPDGSTVYSDYAGNWYVMLPLGNTTATFPILTGTVSANTAATITGSIGSVSRSAAMTITPTLVSSIVVKPATAYASDTVAVTVTLNHPAVSASGGLPAFGATHVTLATGLNLQYPSGPDPDGSSVFPGSDGNLYLSIPQGNTTATFTALAFPVKASTTLPITASLNGSVKSANLTIAVPHIASVALNPATVFSGNTTSCTVTLTHPATVTGDSGPNASGVVVNLGASTPLAQFSNVTNPDGSNVYLDSSGNWHVLIPAGQTTATFPIAVGSVSANTTAAITATVDGLSRSASMTIAPTLVSAIGISPTAVHNGELTTVRVTLNHVSFVGSGRYHQFGWTNVQIAGADGLQVNNGTDTDGSSISMYPDGNTYLQVPPGSISASFTIVSASPVSAATVAKLTASLNGSSKSASFTINPEHVASVTISPATIVSGGVTAMTVTLDHSAYFSYDPWGSFVLGDVVALTGTSPAASFVTGTNDDGSSVSIGLDGNPYLTIPIGNISATASVLASSVTRATSVTLGASLHGTSKTAKLLVTPSP